MWHKQMVNYVSKMFYAWRLILCHSEGHTLAFEIKLEIVRILKMKFVNALTWS